MPLIQIDPGSRLLDRAAAFRILKELLGFVLFMHRQIPFTIEELQQQCEYLSATIEEDQAPNQRQQRAKMRKASREMKKLGKLKTSVDSLLSAAQVAMQELPEISSMLLVLGSSPIRPREAYEVRFDGINLHQGTDEPFKWKNVKADNLSRKIIRALISRDAGCLSTGPSKLFFLVQAPASSSTPFNFLPKRGYSLSKKKVEPVVLQLYAVGFPCDDKSASTHISAFIPHDTEVRTDDMIWFQCKQSIKAFTIERFEE